MACILGMMHPNAMKCANATKSHLLAHHVHARGMHSSKALKRAQRQKHEPGRTNTRARCYRGGLAQSICKTQAHASIIHALTVCMLVQLHYVHQF